MPPRLIMSRQFGMRKGEQFTPELIWQSVILTLIFQAHLTSARRNFGEYAVYRATCVNPAARRSPIVADSIVTSRDTWSFNSNCDATWYAPSRSFR